jgi:hypothetical protein
MRRRPPRSRSALRKEYGSCGSRQASWTRPEGAGTLAARFDMERRRVLVAVSGGIAAY